MAAAAVSARGAAEEEKSAQWVSKDGQVVVLNGEGGGQVRVVVRADDEGDGTVTANAVVVKERTAAGDEDEGNSGWLGVQIGTTTESDDVTEPVGVVILNVIEDSPAEAAGFAANDVIVEVDDQPIGADLETFVDKVRAAGVGARVKFTVLRDGERRTLVGTLGSRPAERGFRWLFKSLPNSILKDDVRTRIKMLVPGEDDEWSFEDVEDLADLPDLAEHVLKILPGSKDKTVEVIVNDGGTTITTTVTRDGNSISVERTGEGEISVTRSQGDEEDVVAYKDEAALEAGDPEAYEIYKDASSHTAINLENVDIEFDGDMAKLHGQLSKLHGLGGVNAFAVRTGKASRTIHENADGSIDVTTRKGDNELVQHYADADDLAARSPKDYDAYQDLRSPEGTR